MRSLRYIMGGRCHTLDDCLDLFGKRAPRRVSLSLRTEETVTEMYVRRDLVGQYTLQLPEGTCCCQDWYGGYCLHDSQPRRDQETRRADERLERRLAQLRAIGVEVEGRERRFAGRLLKAPPGRAVSASA